jgi:hypothetical protein
LLFLEFAIKESKPPAEAEAVDMEEAEEEELEVEKELTVRNL